MKLPKNQVGGRKEAQLARAGRESQGSDQARVYVPTDAEYVYYHELLQGFFKKLTRWHEIAKEFEVGGAKAYRKLHPGVGDYDEEDYASFFSVRQTRDGFAIRPSASLQYPPPHDLVLDIAAHKSSDISRNRFSSNIRFHSGQAGEQLFLDLDHKPIRNAEIIVFSENEREETSPTRTLVIYTDLASDKPEEEYVGQCYVEYEIKSNTLQIKREEGIVQMSDAYATHLFETIDSLIPGSTALHPRLEYRATLEQVAQRQVPPALRTLPPGRRPIGR